ncbi:MAG: EAL domain-containing protein [Sulfurimonas sp.]|uniref:EAL domain-containing protein n=1 Tax=Sulfurimonas sp. TaxID=2022749 RepID=UPI0028CE2E76|nr:EAL domain-containing protein [Sulfurimonas sp.]MDT8339648.1 EAL domain-containing protein [Sulfurimonas sp.]
MAKLENYLTQIADFYEKSDDCQKSSIVAAIETILNAKEEVAIEIDEISALPNRESLMREISLLQDEAMLVILHINQIEAIKQLYGFEMVQDIISNKAETLKHLIKDSDASLYSINLQKFALLVKSKKLFDKYLSILKFSIFNNIESFTYTSCDGSRVISDFTAGISYGIEHLHHSANVALQEAMVSKLSYKIYNINPECTTLEKSNLDKYQVYKDALHNGYIVPYFQPIIDSRDGSIMKYEALARLQLPDGRVVQPYDFLSIAIEDRTFEFFTRQMMQKVFNVYDKTYVEISMNLTYENIKSQTMLEYIKNRLEKYGGERITFEIVETEEIDDYEVVENFILMIKEYGCKISIDDFGSGYSNFTNLIKLNIDFIKIDGTLIIKLLSDEKARLMVQWLIQFAKNINIKSIAEFVSSHEISECVKELGVDYLQGYYHGEPKEAKFYGLA